MTATHELTDRYVHATLRDLPESRRADIARELRSTIADMVEGHLASGADPQEAERAALVALGHPGTLAANYLDGPHHLIGPRFYGVWRRLLRTLLAWVPALVGALSLIADVADGDAAPNAVGAAIVAALMTAVQICFWVTIVFAAIERSGEGDDVLAWSPDTLPARPSGPSVPLGEAVAGAAFSFAIAALLVGQHFFTRVGDSGRVPLLDPDLWSFWLPYLVAAAVASGIVELVRHWTGWSVVMCMATIVTSLATALPIAWLAAQERLLNPAFVAEVSMSQGTFDVVTKIIVASALLVCLWEVGDALWHTFLKPGRTDATPDSGR